MSDKEDAPQTLEQKLAQGKGERGGKARASLEQLRRLFGGVKVLATDAQGVVRVWTNPMDSPRTWVRVSRDVYEVEE